MPQTFEPGAVVYCRDGRKAQFVAMDGEDYVIRLAWSRGEQEDEEYYERVTTVREVWATPPIELYAAEIALARADLEAVQAKVNGLHETRRRIEGGMKDIMAKAERGKGLGNLQLFLDGAINFFVIVHRSNKIEVKAAQEALKVEDSPSYEKRLRLLTLYGDTKGNISWGLNRWGDGSGSDTEVWPFATIEDANAKAAEIIQEKARECLEVDGLRYSWMVEGLLESARRLGVTVPQQLLTNAREARVAAMAARRDKAVQDLAEAQAKLDATMKEQV